MINLMEREQIKKLIKDGFDLKLISFELEISIEELKKIQEEISNERRNTPKKRVCSIEQINQKRNKEAHYQIQRMKRKYNELYTKTETRQIKKEEEITEEKKKEIDTELLTIEKVIYTMRGISQEEKKKIGYLVLEQIEKVQKQPLTLKQLEKLNAILQAEEIKTLDPKKSDQLPIEFENLRRIGIQKLVQKIDFLQVQTEEIEELERLSKKITIEMGRVTQLASAIKNKINNKILKIKQQNVINRMYKDMPVNIQNIIVEITQGKLDVTKAKEIIEEIVEKERENKPQTKFSFTKEQEKKKIFMQIHKAMTDNAEKYPIQNPELALTQMQELFGESKENVVGIVVENLIQQKDFEKAKRICDKLVYSDEEPYRRILKQKIRNAEIGDLVQRGMNSHGTVEEEREYFEQIERGIEQAKVKLTAIPIGKSKDGLTTIYLSDIWESREKEGEIL